MRLNPVLILDTETTALDPKEGHCIEVAVSLYDTEAGGVLESYSSLIRAEENPAVHVNRITPSLLRMAPPAQEVWARIRELGEKVDLVLAHNASFDRAWAVEPQNKRWICTMHDLHATILHLLGMDHERLTFRFSGRDFRLTDVHGRVVKEILS